MQLFVGSHKWSPLDSTMEVKYASVAVGNIDYWVGAMEKFTESGLGEED